MCRFRQLRRGKGGNPVHARLMADSRLNGAERALQHSFRKFRIFNGLLMAAVVMAAYLPLRELPDRKPVPPARLALTYRPVSLPPVNGPLKLAGAWQLEVGDRRFGGLSALAIDRGRFLAVSDRGAVARFHFPGTAQPMVELADLRQGPGPFAKKWGRDAESLARDPEGRGWWVGFEQIHSLWLYDDRFDHALARFDLDQPNWSDNRGAEGLLASRDGLLVTAENGRDAIEISSLFSSKVDLGAGADVADAARAPDGRPWLLLRKKGLQGISQSIAPLLKSGGGCRAGPAIPLPKGAFDNFEGMAIEPSPGGGLRFWLITDDGHRFLARTLLVALDLDPPNAGHDKSPATGAGLSKIQQ
jgi:hypothetical protein